MRKVRQQNIGSQAVATKGDIEQLREDIHADISQHTVSKKEFKEEMDIREERIVRRVKEDMDVREERIVRRLQVVIEHREEELGGVHQDELDIVAGKKEASSQWQSVPRRLKTVEIQVEKIKDHLAIP